MSRGTWQSSGTWQANGPSGDLVLAVIVAAVLIGSGAAHAITSLLVTIAIVLGSTIGLAVLGGIAWLVYRARRNRPGRPSAARPVYQLPPRPGRAWRPPGRPVLEPGREIHLHLNVTPDQLAAILRHHTEEDR